MNKTTRFFFSTLVAAAAMTSTAFAEGTTLYVDSSITESTDGYGVTKFASVDAAVKAAENTSGAIIDLGTLSRPENFPFISNTSNNYRINGSYTFTGGNYGDLCSWIQTPKPNEASNVDIDITFDSANIVVGKFRLDTGSSLTITNSHLDSRGYSTDNRAWTTFYGDSTISIKNSVVGYHAKDNAIDGRDADSRNVIAGDKTVNYSSYDAGMVFGGSGVMTVEGSTIFAFTETTGGYGALGVMDRGLMEFKDSSVYAHSFTVGRTSTGGATAVAGRENAIATMILDNSVLRDINGDPNYTITIGQGNAGALILKNNAEIDHGAAMTVNSNGYVSVSDSKMQVGNITNKNVIKVGDSTLSFSTLQDQGTGAQLYVTGISTISGTSILGDNKLRIGQLDSDENGVADGFTENNNITLDVKDVSITFGNIHNATVRLAQDTSITLTGTYGNGYLFATNSTFDLQGHTLAINGAFMLNASIKNGTVDFNGYSGENGWANIVFQTATSEINSDAVVNINTGSAISVYEDLKISGELNDKREAIGWSTILVGHQNASGYTDGAVLTVSGENAKFVSEHNSMTICGANIEKGIQASELIVENGALVDIGGTIVNESKIEVRDEAMLVAVNLSNKGSIILNNATLKVTGTLTNAGTITMLGDSTIDDGNAENGAGVALQEISVSTENGTVELSAAGNILFAGVTETTADGLTLDAAQEVLIAWDINVDAQGQSVEVSMDIGEGLDGNQIKVFHEGSNGDWTEVESSYDAETGKVSFTTNSFSKYAVAIPEPSMFGLLAGLGALALVGARRRRR